MTPAFADTSFFAALVSLQDQYHRAAVGWLQTNRRPVITTGFILVEVGSLLARADRRAACVRVWDLVRQTPGFIYEPLTEELLLAGCELFRHRPDKDWSLIDCTSFEVMRRMGLTYALTADHHFIQAGFRAVLLDPPDSP